MSVMLGEVCYTSNIRAQKESPNITHLLMISFHSDFELAAVLQVTLLGFITAFPLML